MITAAPCGPSSAIYDVAVPGSPFAAVPSADGQAIFVSLNSSDPAQENGIGILRCIDGRYRFERTIPLESQPAIAALTHDGKALVVPDDAYAVVVDVQRALARTADPIMGYVQDPAGRDDGAVFAAISPDDRYAFIAEEYSGTLRVVDLAKLRASRGAQNAIVSEISIGNGPISLIVSKNGRYLFATVQVALPRYSYVHSCTPEGDAGGDKEASGAVITIDLEKIVSNSQHAIATTTPAGCHPVRAALTPDGRTLWVTSRKDNAVLAFSTAKLIAGDPNAKIASVSVGSAPVPVLATRDGRYVLVADSNRFGQGANGNQLLHVIDARSHLVVGQIGVGRFPRQFGDTASGSTIFVCNYGSNTVTVIDLAALPRVMKPVAPR